MTYYELYYGKDMTCYIYERGKSRISELCEAVMTGAGFTVIDGKDADIAIAPLLETIIPGRELDKFKVGVLIFHPSLLPIYRGKTSIGDAYKAGDKYTGVTWFWAAPGIDKGDICEQSVLPIPDKRPSEFYNEYVIPEAVRLLEFAAKDIKAGVIRRRPQNEIQ